MSNNSNNPQGDAQTKDFLKEWFSGLMEGIERLNDETWPKLLEMTGRACARVHAVELFEKTWEDSNNIDDFIININESMDEKIFKKIDDNTLSVTYLACKCPLVNMNLVNSPLLCNCSPNWLMENFETIFGKPVTVKTEKTILRGDKSCNFTISF